MTESFRFLRLLLLCVIAAVLVACSSAPQQAPTATPAAKPSQSRYGDLHDSAPEQLIDTSKVPDAVPRYEVRTMAGNKNPYTVLGKTYHLIQDERSYKERGRASWYGKKFHGYHTSNGEIYDMYAMTAAHKTLPIPSYVRVTNTANGKSVVVRVNDRGPFHSDRIIDLSYAAAQRIGILGAGTGAVEVEIVLPSDAAPPPRIAEPLNPIVVPGSALPPNTHLQIGAFSSEKSAKQFAAEVGVKLSYPVKISRAEPSKTIFRVRVGPLGNAQQLQDARNQLQRLNIPESHVVYE